MKTHYRAVFISDLHLGSLSSKTPQLLAFLKSVECEYLYLVGDIVDLLAGKKRLYWNDTTTAIVRRILKMSERGTKVFYLPGNHDEFFRKFTPLDLGPHFSVVDCCIHTTVTGKSLLVLHGDKFDFIVGHARWLTVLGSRVYDVLLRFNTSFYAIRSRLGYKQHWSLSAFLKAKTKKAISFVKDFESSALQEAKRQGCEGVVCGHIHTARVEQKPDGLYVNCGDWVESLTAVVEQDGELNLLHFSNLT